MAPVAADRVEDHAGIAKATTPAPAASAKTLSELRQQEAKQATASTVGGNSLNGWLAIGLVLMVMGAVAMWLKRKSKPTGLPTAEDITPLAVTRLWGKHSIGLVRVSGRVLVVGLGETGMSLLTELEEAELPSPVPAADASEREQRDFTTSLMNRFQSKKNSSANDPFGAMLNNSSLRQAGNAGGGQIQLTPLKAPTQPGPAEELLGLSEERAAIRRRLDALRQRNLRVA
jgi:flagellar biogenesis protein FliO